MNKILIVDAYDASRIMAGLLMRAGYEPVSAESIEIGKVEVAKLPPGAVIVTTMRLPDGTVTFSYSGLPEPSQRACSARYFF